jgi:hypothetical protein
MPDLKADWSMLSPRERRSFLALIAEPDDRGCCAWHGHMCGGSPEWEKTDHVTGTRIRGKVRRLLAQSLGMEFSDFDQILASCENPGCVAPEHLYVNRRKSQEITDEEKEAALRKRAGRPPRCRRHTGADFRSFFVRDPSGNVRICFKCTQCELQRKRDKNTAGKSFREARSNA